MDARTLLHILEEVVSLSTCPFHEGAVIQHIEDFARQRGIPCHRDAFGNVLVGLEQTRDGSTPIVLTAHMDHPGFEVLGKEGDLYRARWMGSVPADYFPDAEVEAFGEPPVPGRIIEYTPDEEGRVKEVLLEMDDEVQTDAFGSWALEPWRVDPPHVDLRAGDDLVGVAALLATLELLWAREDRVNVMAAFTRGEEIGFLGAMGLIKAESLPEEAPVITVECSSELPAVRMGRGPVIRVGDRLGTFDFNLTHFLAEVAQSIGGLFDDFVWQRALMDGGTCESTVFALNGHPAACVAFPIGNFHNRGEDGYTIVSERVHVVDFFAGVTLLVEAVKRWKRHGPDASNRLLDRLVARSKDAMVRLANDDLSS